RAQRQDAGVVGGTFGTVVPGMVVVAAVAVVLAIGLVVLVVVGNQVLKREAIVRADEIDAGPGSPVAPVEQLRGGAKPRGQVTTLAEVPAPEGPHGIAEAVVPFGPAGREIAKLVTARPHVPRLGDQLH